MSLLVDVFRPSSRVFVDTAPIIYFIEAHAVYGPLVKQFVSLFSRDHISACTSVITLAEVLVAPYAANDAVLIEKFSAFLIHGRSMSLLEVSARMAQESSRLRSRYQFLKAFDALQLATAAVSGVQYFLTNDKKLRQVDELEIVILDDHV